MNVYIVERYLPDVASIQIEKVYSRELDAINYVARELATESAAMQDDEDTFRGTVSTDDYKIEQQPGDRDNVKYYVLLHKLEEQIAFYVTEIAFEQYVA